jgi:hypothetical protein
MKKILFLSGVITLLTTAGCLVAEDGGHGYYRGNARFERRPDVIVAAPVVVVRPPEIIVR